MSNRGAEAQSGGMCPSIAIRQCSARGADRGSDARYESLQRPCPTCGEPGVRIVYGYPGGALVRAAARGLVVLGGCTYRAATHRCPHGHEWEGSDPD